MFPLHDTARTRKFPIITLLIIFANIYVFFLELVVPNTDLFLAKYALIPSKVNFSDLTTLAPFVTSQFLHAGFVHILSNMWFLKIFGDNVEERFGSFFYLVVYLASGVVGGFIQYIFAVDSNIPMLGASGAVAGVMGSYFVFFPRHKINTLVPFGFFMTTVRIPASVILGYWFLTQFFSGVGSIVVVQVGGIAWWAHVGGFVTGYLIAKLSQGNSEEKAEGEVLDI